MTEITLLIIIILINIFLWFILFFRLKKTFSPKILLHDIKNEVEKLLIEINRTADEDITLIEARIKGLKALIAEADRRILLFQGQTEERKREQEILQKLSATSNATLEGRAVEKYKKMGSKIPPSINFDFYHDRLETQEEVLPTTYSELPIISHVIDSPLNIVDDPINEVPLRQQVLKLDGEGISSDIIAEKLGISITEVQLIIDISNP